MPITSPLTATERSRSRAESTAHREIIEMLKNDHKRVIKAFRDFERMSPHQDPERCQSLVTQTCNELEVHTQIEEKCFYPATFTVLGEYVKHHIREEEHEIFPQLSRAKLDWQHLQEDMTKQRDELMQQFMPQSQTM